MDVYQPQDERNLRELEEAAPRIRWRELRDWLLVGKGLAVATVVYRLRAARFMLKCGFRWDKYSGVLSQLFPSRAQRLGEEFLAAQIERSGRNSLPRYVDVLNDLARFLERRRRGFRRVRFEPVKAGYVSPRPLTSQQLVALEAYRGASGFVTLRRRAMLRLMGVVGLRRAEFRAMRVEDFDKADGVLRVSKPAKNGKPRCIPLPASLWSGRVLSSYLLARARVAGNLGPLWVSEEGVPLTLWGLGQEMYEIRKATGVPVSFNRFRRTRFTELDRLRVPLTKIQFLAGHSKPETTIGYLDQGTEPARAALREAGVPGY